MGESLEISLVCFRIAECKFITFAALETRNLDFHVSQLFSHMGAETELRTSCERSTGRRRIIYLFIFTKKKRLRVLLCACSTLIG